MVKKWVNVGYAAGECCLNLWLEHNERNSGELTKKIAQPIKTEQFQAWKTRNQFYKS